MLSNPHTPANEDSFRVPSEATREGTDRFGSWVGRSPAIRALYTRLREMAEGSRPLLIQGEPDVIQPVEATRELHRRLVDCGVPAVNIIFPLTNHAFDLLLPVVSPPAQAAHYYLDRFLALMV